MRVMLVLTLLFLIVAPAGDVLAKGEPNAIESVIQSVTLGKGVTSHQIIIFPLLAPAPPEKLAVKPDRGNSSVTFGEPEWSKRRYDLNVTNKGLEPALILGGTVLEGGVTDRLVPQDVILPAGGSLDMDALPAASKKDKRKEAAAFKMTLSTAPVYLREKSLRDTSNWVIRHFIDHYEEFIVEGDKRRSLAAIDSSPTLGQFCIACQSAMGEFPGIGGGRVVGFISAVRGRLHLVELFGSNELMRNYFSAILRSHTYTAAAIRLRAKKAGIKTPMLEPMLMVAGVRKDAQKLLDRLKKARYRKDRQPEGAAGKAMLIRTSRERGRGIALNGRLVHATLFPHEPFERALYGKDLELEDDIESEEYRPGSGELGNRQGRLTEYERRLLDRLRRGGGIGGSGSGARPRGGGIGR